MITRDEVVAALHGIEYGTEDSAKFREIFRRAKEARLVIVFGYSDDNVEFRGAIDDEVGVGERAIIKLTPNGLLFNPCDKGDRCPNFKLVEQSIPTTPMYVFWCREATPEIAWTYDIEVPHSTFDVMEDAEIFCRGIVFSLDDIR